MKNVRFKRANSRRSTAQREVLALSKKRGSFNIEFWNNDQPLPGPLERAVSGGRMCDDPTGLSEKDRASCDRQWLYSIPGLS